MRTKSVVFLALLLGLLSVSVFLACATDEEEEEEQPTGTLDEDDNDPTNPQTGDDDATGDDDDATDDDDTAGDDDAPCDGKVEARELVYAPWNELPVGRQSDFIAAFGDVTDAKEFFARFVYWFGVAREAVKSSRAFYRFADPAYPLSLWDEEVLAAEMAVSYYRSRGETQNIFTFHAGTVTLHNHLDSPLPPTGDPKTIFNNNAELITQDPEAYLWFQTYWAKEAVTATNEVTFHLMVDEFLCPAINEATELPFQQPHFAFDETLPQVVFDAFDNDLGTWNLKLNPELSLTIGLRPGLVVFE